MDRLSLHHLAFVVCDLASMQDFYGKLGFGTTSEWSAEDGSFSIVLLSNGEATVELFVPARLDGRSNAQAEIEADLRIPGIRHVAFATPDMDGLLEALKAKGIEPVVPPRIGRTGRKITFVKDPEGNWVEFVED